MGNVAILALRHAFIARLAEWAFAVIMALWGVVLLMPEKRFADESWAAFGRLADETTVGLICLLLGVARLVVLAANGTWRPMYHLRALTALWSALIWFAITLGFLSAGVMGTWLAVYPVLFAFDVVNMFRATGDAAAADKAARAQGAIHGSSA